jgi:hypothetical protein
VCSEKKRVRERESELRLDRPRPVKP